MANRTNTIDLTQYGFLPEGGLVEREVCPGDGTSRRGCGRVEPLLASGRCAACEDRYEACVRQEMADRADERAFYAGMAEKYGSVELFDRAMSDMELAAWATGLS